jgi:hypothetical protein
VRDIQVHPRDNDLIIGTHGVGAWILDDIGPLQELSAATNEEVYLFDVRPAIRWTTGSRDASMGQREFRAPNPPNGAYFNYFLASAPSDPVVFTVKDGTGAVVTTLRNPNVTAGVNRTVWNFRHEGATPIADPGSESAGGGGGRFGGGGPPAMPGEYTVTLRAAGQELASTFRVEADPRIEGVSQADYQVQFDAAMALRDLSSQVNLAIRACTQLETQINGLLEAVRASDVANKQEIVMAGQAALGEVQAFEATLRRPPPRMGYRQAPRLSEEIRSLNSSITSVPSRPTEAEMMRLDELEVETAQKLDELNQLMNSTIADLNQMVGSFPRIMVERPE